MVVLNDEVLRKLIALLATNPEVRALFEADPSAFAKQYDVDEEDLEQLQANTPEPGSREFRPGTRPRRYTW